MLNQKIIQLILKKKMANKETLEEAAERLFPDNSVQKRIFIKGAKWQQEQMEKLKDFDTWKEWKSKL